MSTTKSCLIEIGTEEMPPLSLSTLSSVFAQQVSQQLEQAGFVLEEVKAYATPRRLAVFITQLNAKTPSRAVERKGPAVKAAFDATGQPTQACLGFATSCGCKVKDLEQVVTDKGDWLVYRSTESGKTLQELLPAIVQKALQQLPIAKRMRWGDERMEFVRPIHWIVLLYGKDIIEGTVFDLPAGRKTRGHRFHYPKEISLSCADDYLNELRKASVLADSLERQDKIWQQVKSLAEEKNAVVTKDETLLQEVTALVEWPVALLGQFDKDFLQVPQEALIMAMKVHQRYFHLTDKAGALLPFFVTLSNIKSTNEQQVIIGNQRVLHARLSDAQFFYEQDLKKSLDVLLEAEKTVLFQAKLGTLYEKSCRVANLACDIATSIHADSQQAKQAGLWCKADLMSDMVGEFPELQGVMGMYYARAQQAPEVVATALQQYYLPRFAKDGLPQGGVAQAVALADRLDTLVGILGIGLKPTGDKDPFGLRRASLGILRILIEGQLPLDLKKLLTQAAAQYSTLSNKQVVEDAFEYIVDRLKGIYADQGIRSDVFLAVMANVPTNPLDFDKRIRAVSEFQKLPQASALAAANKRVGRILPPGQTSNGHVVIDHQLLESEAEKDLAALLEKKQIQVLPLYQEAKYQEALTQLASLKEPVDRFFNEVMVMVEDEQVKNNRLAILRQLHQLFLHVADISLLQ